MSNNTSIYDYIIVSSRIRLARNFSEYKFPHKISDAEADKIISIIFNICDSIGNFNNYRLKNLSHDLMLEYMNDHLISEKLIESGNNTAVCVSSDNSVSIMVNEEDVLRQQCTLSGLNLKKAYDIINDIDTEIGHNIDFAFDEKYGFITACPTNLGTGMRASVMLFLPGLTLTKNIDKVIETVSKMGISVRGAYGEGSVASGYLYQVSNQNSLGKSEYDIIQNVESTVLKICELEKKARLQLLDLNDAQLRNDVLRAFGVLTNSFKLSYTEAVELLSKVKLGLSLEIIKLQNPKLVDDLLLNINIAKINKISKKNLDEDDIDIFRAEYINRVLKNERIVL